MNVPILHRLARVKRFFHRLGIAVGNEYWNGLLTLQAMGLVYTTLLSLIPLLAVVFSVLKAFEVHQQIEPFLTQALAPLGPQGGEIVRRLVEFVNNLRVGVLGTLGLAGLFFTVFSLLSQIESALNYIWRVRRTRSLARRFSDYFSLALVGPVLVFTAFALTVSAQSHWLTQWMLQIPYLNFLVAFGTRIMPFLFLCIAFTLLYKLIPYTQVSLAAALVGGLTGGGLWLLAGAGFTAFVANSVYYTAVYSSFAILVVFLLWLYVGWLIVLVGGEVAYVYQYPYAYLAWGSWRRQGYVFHAWLTLSALTEITRRYLAEKPPWRLTELATTLNVSVTSLEEVIDEFVRCGILLRAAEPEGIALRCPPEHVPVSKVLEILDGADLHQTETAAESEDPVSHLLFRRDQAIHSAFAGVTLRTVATELLTLSADSHTPAALPASSARTLNDPQEDERPFPKLH
jgi:membrane protein